MTNTFEFNIVLHSLWLGAEEKREEAETQASELLIKQRSLDELLAELGSKGPRSVAKTREQVMIKHWKMIIGIFIQFDFSKCYQLLQILSSFQVIEWQKKLEDIRLRELRSRRNADRWAKEVDHLR